MSRIIPKRRLGYKWGDPTRERLQKLREGKIIPNPNLSEINMDPIIEDIELQDPQVSMVSIEDISMPSTLNQVKSPIKQPSTNRKIVRKRVVKKKRKSALNRPQIRTRLRQKQSISSRNKEPEISEIGSEDFNSIIEDEIEEIDSHNNVETEIDIDPQLETEIELIEDEDSSLTL